MFEVIVTEVKSKETRSDCRQIVNVKVEQMQIGQGSYLE